MRGDDHTSSDTHDGSVLAPPPTGAAIPTYQSAAGDDQSCPDIQVAHVVAPPPNLPTAPMNGSAAGDGQRAYDDQWAHVVAPPPNKAAKTISKPAAGGDHGCLDNHSRPDPATAALVVDGEALDDLERLRIATNNRITALERDGLGDLAGARKLLELIEAAERQATRNLERTMRVNPLGEFVASTPGLGFKSVGRLLAVIGDPADRERPSSLRRYCGMAVNDGVAPARRKGEHIDWNPKARMRLFLIAESCMKTRSSPYRAIYDAGRAKYAEATHERPCARCGPKGHPAPAGSPLSDGHKHARALRLVAKAALLDLWRVSVGQAPRHTLVRGDDQPSDDDQSLTVVASPPAEEVGA